MRFQKLSILHGYKYIYESLMEKVMAEKNEKCREIVNDLGLLFGCNVIVGSNVSSVLLEGGFMTPEQIESLIILK